MEYGIQLYSLRDICARDLAAGLRAVAEMGYHAVEFAGFFGHEAATVRGWLQDCGLRVSGAHIGCADLAAKALEDTIAYHQAIGNRRLIVAGTDLSTPEKQREFVELAGQAIPRLQAAGLCLGYHNHTAEFAPATDGSIPFAVLEEKTDLFFEVDTFWAWQAGQDPLALLRRLGARVPVIHLKDGFADGEGRTLGKGQAPVAAVLRAAAALGMEQVVESETLQPDGPTEARLCMEWLRTQTV